MSKKEFLEIGEVVGTHGIAGEMRVQAWCDSADVFCGFKTLYADAAGTEKLKVKSRPHKNIVLVKVDGVNTPEAAAQWRGKVLFAARRDFKLPKGRHFICDLLGLDVKDADTGEVYGTVTDVTNHGAGDIYTIKTAQGKEILIPAIPDIVIAVDPDGEGIVIRPMEGLFDEI